MLTGQKSKQAHALAKLLQAQDMAIMRGCLLLFITDSLSARIHDPSQKDCAAGLAQHFPTLCNHCPCRTGRPLTGTRSFEISDGNRAFSVRMDAVTWLDDKPATSLLFTDITDMKRAQAELSRLAYSDALTGLPNRLCLRTRFEAMEEEIRRGKKEGILALLDLDHFKDINDTYGHSAGDAVLRRLADCITAKDGFYDHMYRLGGDEFILLFSEEPGCFATEADFLAHYRERISQIMIPYTTPDIESFCTLSVGVAVFPKHGNTYSDILRKADIALYKSKGLGRNSFTFF